MLAHANSSCLDPFFQLTTLWQEKKTSEKLIAFPGSGNWTRAAGEYTIHHSIASRSRDMDSDWSTQKVPGVEIVQVQVFGWSWRWAVISLPGCGEAEEFVTKCTGILHPWFLCSAGSSWKSWLPFQEQHQRFHDGVVAVGVRRQHDEERGQALRRVHLRCLPEARYRQQDPFLQSNF